MESGGPNANIELLTMKEQDKNGTQTFLFAQECSPYSGDKGVVTEIFLAWVGGYPLLQAPLYGSSSRLPASSSWAKVVHDDSDPMCVH